MEGESFCRWEGIGKLWGTYVSRKAYVGGREFKAFVDNVLLNWP